MIRHFLVAPVVGRRSCLLRQVIAAPATAVATGTAVGTLETGVRRNFSSPAPQYSLKIPSNLKIDPRSSFAPVRSEHKPTLPGSDEKGDENEQDKERDNSAVTQGPEGKEDASTAEEFYSEEEEDDEEGGTELFLRQPEVLYATPLPDRLNVEIHTLFAPVYDSTVGTIWLDENVFGRDPIRVDLLKRAVLYYRNKKRGRRTAHSKGISDVSGSGRKLRPQKGQGMARVGHSRPPHFRGGAKAHGPSNLTDYGNTKLNKKVRRQALCHALSQKLLEGNFILLDQLHGLPSYKTRELARILQEWGLGEKKGEASALIIDSYFPEEDSENTVATHYGVPVPFYLAVSNLPRITLGNDHAASVYDILRHDKLVMTLAALEKLEARLKHV